MPNKSKIQLIEDKDEDTLMINLQNIISLNDKLVEDENVKHLMIWKNLLKNVMGYSSVGKSFDEMVKEQDVGRM